MTILDTFNNLVLNDNNENNNTTSKLVKSAAVISTLAVCFYGCYYYLSQATATNALQPAVTEEEAKKIMKSILDKLIILQPKLTGALQNIKMQIMNSGQEVEDSIIMKQYILPHLQTQLIEIQTVVYAEYSVDEDEVEEAVNTYTKAGDDELSSIQKQIRSIFRKFGADIDDDDDDEEEEEEDKDGGNDDIDDSASSSNSNTKSKSRVVKRVQKKKKNDGDIAQLVELMNELTTQLLASTDDYCGCFIEKNGLPTTKEEFEQFQMGLMAISQGVEKNILDQEGMTELEFQSVLIKHQSNQRIQEIFLSMQIENGKLLQRHGIRLEG